MTTAWSPLHHHMKTLPSAEGSSKAKFLPLVVWRGCLLFFGPCLPVQPVPNSHSVCREESEKVSELKSVSGSNKLPYGTLALGSEGIKDAITGFEDACVSIHASAHNSISPSDILTDGSPISRMSVCRLNFSTQKRPKLTCRILNRTHSRAMIHPQKASPLPSHRQASLQVWKLPLKAVQSPPLSLLVHPLLLGVCRSSVGMADKRVSAQR